MFTTFLPGFVVCLHGQEFAVITTVTLIRRSNKPFPLFLQIELKDEETAQLRQKVQPATCTPYIEVPILLHTQSTRPCGCVGVTDPESCTWLCLPMTDLILQVGEGASQSHEGSDDKRACLYGARLSCWQIRHVVRAYPQDCHIELQQAAAVRGTSCQAPPK